MTKTRFTLTNIFIAATCLKVLLFVAYHSTDFEVHRNWLAITYNLPVREWYVEKTSQWTLDYPPFFAWFEWILAQLAPQAVRLDGALDIVEQGQYGWPTVAYQRTTVIVTEIVLFLALQWYIDNADKEDKYDELRRFAVAGSIVLSPGLLIIDHIHFQYNGFMYGIMIYSIIAAQQGRLLLSGALFAILLCFKHIYLYLAPAYFVYLLRAYILPGYRLNFVNGIKLGSVVVGVFAVAFAPFVYYGEMPNLLERLFPFSRGLTHAYWAPNVWAFYSFVDRVLGYVYNTSVASATRGIVGDVSFAVLPDIAPRTTFVLTVFYQLLALGPLFLWPNIDRFLASLTLCGYASFLFGWHVHEKAILLVIFPMSFLALKDRRILQCFIPLAVAGYISLFPLIFTSGEALLKSLYTFVWFVMFLQSFNTLVRVSSAAKRRIFLLDRAVMFYLFGFVPLLIGVNLIDRLLPRFEFLQLMMMSVYCSIGVIGSWAGFSWLYFFDDVLW
ncbi:dolichyl pyrophosphate Glc1Man9GlcNAc2 alpha-1,3-glucosyltransferase [Trichomonascus vanleenenianus]|uniref:dolichyl-P-Glc:Glc1Man(9)GlcNAc(2)-PP-dolichol alpha-1,3-glucosyltransferase n=1 Tax=Trichomonascus vanleenenianus TaxID=2268995 RepID=UPI003ECB6C63